MSISDYALPKIKGVMSMTQFKNRISKLDPALKYDLSNVRVNGQLQGCSGFVTDTKTGKIAYISTDRNHGSNSKRALYRTSQNTRDFSGGLNKFATFEELPQAVIELLK